jgi:sugar phosphate permease
LRLSSNRSKNFEVEKDEPAVNTRPDNEKEEKTGSSWGAYAWIAWGLGATFFGYGFFQRMAPSVMVEDLMRDYGVGAALLGNLSAFYFYSYACLQIPVGVAVDWWGPRRILTGGAFLCGVGTVLFAATDHLALAYLGRLLIGAGAGFAVISTLKLATILFPLRRFAFLSGLTTMIGMVGAIGGQAPLAMAIESLGWRSTMVGAAVFAFVLAGLSWLIVRDGSETVSRARAPSAGMDSLLQGLRTVVATPQNWIIFTIAFSRTVFLLVFAGLWGVPYMMQAHGVERPVAAASTSLMMIGWAMGAPMAGWLSDHIGRRKLPMLVGACGVLATFVVLVYGPGVTFFTAQVLLFINGFCASSMTILFATAREHNIPSAAGATIGFVNTANMLSGALLQPTIGWLLDLNWDGTMEAGARIYSVETYQTAFLGLVACGIITIIGILLIRETHCRQMVT